MTIFYLTIFHLIITTLFVYGQDLLNPDECIPVYKLLGKEQSNNCCSEEGILCKNGHIVQIQLNNTLSGSIPPEIGNLSQLQNLYLYESHLSGTIPSEIGKLSSLKNLFLFSNKLCGSIPPELGNLSQLEILSLNSNNFTGQIPKELGKLTKLQILYLVENKLDGSIPTELGNLNQLTELNLCFNNFNSSIPPELGNLNQLTKLNLGFNNFTGQIPKELGKLTKLQNLDLVENNLDGSIPTKLGNLNQLTELDLSNNHLTGPIPKELENLKQLTKFDFSYNDLCGDIPNLPNNCEIDDEGNRNFGNECSNEEIQNNNSNNKTNNNNGNSQKILLIIVGVCALLLILIILVFKIKNSNKKDNDNSHVSEQELLNYAFKEKKYFEWKIENWNQLKDKEYSSAFKANEHLWKLMLITNSYNEEDKESIDVGLSLCDEIDKKEFIYANFIVYFRNYHNNQIYKEVQYNDKPTFYNAKILNHGINDAILKSELYDKTNDGCPLLENNKIIIGILINFYSVLSK